MLERATWFAELRVLLHAQVAAAFGAVFHLWKNGKGKNKNDVNSEAECGWAQPIDYGFCACAAFSVMVGLQIVTRLVFFFSIWCLGR